MAMVVLGAFPFYFGMILVKTFVNIIPVINKAKLSDFRKRHHLRIFSSLKNPIPCAAMEANHDASQYQKTNRPYSSIAVER